MTLPKKINTTTITLTLILILGLILRLIALPSYDFWYDEAYTYFISKLSIGDILAVSKMDNNPPLYYLLIHFLLRISKNEIILRLPSLIAGIATIFATYFLAKKLINLKTALASAVLVSLSPLTVYLSTEARPHSLGILLVTLAILTFLTLIKKPTILNSFLFILATIIGLYTHYYLLLLFVPFSVLVLTKTSNLSFKRWLLIVLVTILLLLPWTASSIKTSHNNCWCPNSLLSLPSSLVSPAISGVGMVTLRVYPKLPTPIFLFLSLTALLTLLIFLKGLIKNLFLATIFLIPLLIISSAGSFSLTFSPKAFAIFSPIFLIITALGALSLKRRLLIPALIVLFGITSLLQSQNYFFKGDRVKSVYELTQTNNSPIAHTSVNTFYPLKYYSPASQQNYLIGTNPLNQATIDYIGGKPLEDVPDSDQVWLVDNSRLTKQQAELSAIAKLLNNYYIDKTYQVGTITVSFLKKRQNKPSSLNEF